MKDFFRSKVLHPTGFAKMQDKDENRHKIGLVLASADEVYLALADHPIGLIDKQALQKYQEDLQREVSAVVVQASYVLDNMTQWGGCPEPDKSMLDFVVAKAWGHYRALITNIDTDYHKAMTSKNKTKK